MERIQAGSPLSEKQGYTHKLIVPHAVHLEASRAFIEETAERIDQGEGTLNTEGAIAKYLATEAGNHAAEAAIQALGGYGYTREYMVEKIKRDVRITTIYEGTSEIMEMTIGRDRWQMHLKTHGQHYHQEAERIEELQRRNSDIGAGVAALSLHGLAEILEKARLKRLTRHQHILFRLGRLIAHVEGSASLARRAAAAKSGELNPKTEARFQADALAAMSRIYSREVAMMLVSEGLQWVGGSGAADQSEAADFQSKLGLGAIYAAQSGIMQDMDYVADVLYDRMA
jgi:alkylation response protein AidB-like acyl-CoA dehydrogenase